VLADPLLPGHILNGTPGLDLLQHTDDLCFRVLYNGKCLSPFIRHNHNPKWRIWGVRSRPKALQSAHHGLCRHLLLEVPAVPAHVPIRILCVEDHPVFREGLRVMISSEPDMVFLGHAANGNEAIALFRHHRPDITLMDVRLPGANGTDILISIRGEFPQARIIMLTTSDGDADILRAMRAGASAYILKSMPMDELLDVIRAVHSGRKHVPPKVAARLAEYIGEDDLTARELDVLRLIRDGYRNKQIADQLAISENTVAFHIKNLMEKLRANDRTHAVTIALRRGLLHI
jgi:DNA-binding NarL/FixJ family response regulator